METVAAVTSLDQASNQAPNEAPNETKLTQTCVVLGLDGKTMQLKLPQYLHVGSAVKVEADDTLSLGEVSYCRPEGDGYVARVEILEALHHVNELTRLARALLSSAR